MFKDVDVCGVGPEPDCFPRFVGLLDPAPVPSYRRLEVEATAAGVVMIAGGKS